MCKADVEKDLFKVLSYQAESVRVPPSFCFKSVGDTEGNSDPLIRCMNAWHCRLAEGYISFA